MCLTDNYCKNLSFGAIIDKFMGEFIHVADTKGSIDFYSAIEGSLFYGKYEATNTFPSGAMRSLISIIP